jgi:hypothetical protein
MIERLKEAFHLAQQLPETEQQVADLLIEEMAPPSSGKDFSMIRAPKSCWSDWSQRPSPKTTQARVKRLLRIHIYRKDR